MIGTSNNLRGTNGALATGQAQSANGVAPKHNAGTTINSPPSVLGPATQVDISDRAKSILDANQSNINALEKLQSLVNNLKYQINHPDTNQSSNAGKGQSSSTPKSLGMQMLVDVNKYFAKQNTNKDGTISSYSVNVNDINLMPRTDKEIDNWYKTSGTEFIEGVFDGNAPEYKEMVQAIRDRKIEFIDPKGIPDLNYHNKAIFQGGEGGGASGLTKTYNTNSVIFKDPEKGYFPLPDGFVISWKKEAPKA